MLVSTDDGSMGIKGYVKELFGSYIDKYGKPSKVYICGPELMEASIVELCDKYNLQYQVSVERHMKCGIGVCGSCCVDETGWRMCVEGPVLNDRQLKRVIEFGKYHRSASGAVQKF